MPDLKLAAQTRCRRTAFSCTRSWIAAVQIAKCPALPPVVIAVLLFSCDQRHAACRLGQTVSRQRGGLQDAPLRYWSILHQIASA
jgi:hypothetical protein